MFETLIDGMSKFWSEGERGKLLVDLFSVSLRRAPVMADREAEPVRAAVSHRFKDAADAHALSPMIPAEVLADFFLLNCLAAMASWCVQPIMPLGDMLRGVTHLFMNGARAPGGPSPVPFKKP